MEGELAKKMTKVKGRSSKEMTQLALVERTRILDRIYLRYEIRTPELSQAVKKYDLENDPDVIAAKNAN